MKFFVAFSVALFASAHAIPAGIVNTGASAVSRSDDGHGNFAFGYNEDHATGGTFRKEKGGPGVQVGSYGLRDADGRIRTVNYVADALGFRASISTNEPGVDPKQDPAAASLTGAGIPVVAPAPLLAAAPLGLEKGLGYGGAAPLGLEGGLGYGAAPLGLEGGLGYGAGPLLNKGYAEGPLLAAPIGIPSSYSVATQHVSAGPILAAPAALGYGAAPAALGYGAAPAALGYGAAPLGLEKGLGYGLGAPALGYGKY